MEEMPGIAGTYPWAMGRTYIPHPVLSEWREIPNHSDYVMDRYGHVSKRGAEDILPILYEDRKSYIVLDSHVVRLDRLLKKVWDISRINDVYRNTVYTCLDCRVNVPSANGVAEHALVSRDRAVRALLSGERRMFEVGGHTFVTTISDIPPLDTAEGFYCSICDESYYSRRQAARAHGISVTIVDKAVKRAMKAGQSCVRFRRDSHWLLPLREISPELRDERDRDYATRFGTRDPNTIYRCTCHPGKEFDALTRFVREHGWSYASTQKLLRHHPNERYIKTHNQTMEIIRKDATDDQAD